MEQLVRLVFVSRTRLFQNWSMRFWGQRPEYEGLFGHLADITGFDARLFQGDQTLRFLHKLAADEEAAAA